MADSIYANLRVHEGIISGAEELTFSPRVGRVTIMNDSATKDLRFKLNLNQDYATLKPTETVSFEARTSNIHISGSGTEYRIWGLG